MAFVLPHHDARMMASATGVENPPKKAISGLPARRRRWLFSIAAVDCRAIFFAKMWRLAAYKKA
jgi:hypothetical protein